MLKHNIIMGKPRIFSEEVGEQMINLCSQTFILQPNVEYHLFITTPDYIGRPDLVSQFLYNTTTYTDIICKINGISNPFELNADKILICPTEAHISSFYLPSEDDYEDDVNGIPLTSNKPQPKQVDEKRSANDSIVNDKRFDIDKENRVVVY